MYCKRETKRVRDNFIHVNITYQLGPVHLLEEFTAKKSDFGQHSAKTVDEILEEIKPSNALMGLISSNSHVLLFTDCIFHSNFSCRFEYIYIYIYINNNKHKFHVIEPENLACRVKTADEILEEIKPTTVLTMLMLMGLISSNSQVLLLHCFILTSNYYPSAHFLIMFVLEIVRNYSPFQSKYNKKKHKFYVIHHMTKFHIS